MFGLFEAIAPYHLSALLALTTSYSVSEAELLPQPVTPLEAIFIAPDGSGEPMEMPTIEHYPIIDEPQLCDCCGIYRLEAGYVFGQFIGQRRSYGQLGLLLAPAPRGSWFPLIDLHGYRLEHHQWAASAGLGARFLAPCRVWGINGYYDWRQGHFSHFHQLGLGFETLGTDWDLRLNGYFPLGQHIHRGPTHHYHDFIGPFHATCQELEWAYQGLDAEVGAPFGCSCNGSTWFYTAIGPYYYWQRQVNHFFGGQARLEFHWSQYLALEVLGSYDHIYHGHIQGRILFSIPFDILFCNPCTHCRTPCKEPIRRNAPLFLDHCCDWSWNW
jgi:hypothetical protein